MSDTKKLSEMQVGDYGILDGDLVELKDNGKQGGCETDLWLAFCGRTDEADLPVDLETVPIIIVDTYDVSGAE